MRYLNSINHLCRVLNKPASDRSLGMPFFEAYIIIRLRHLYFVTLALLYHMIYSLTIHRALFSCVAASRSHVADLVEARANAPPGRHYAQGDARSGFPLVPSAVLCPVLAPALCKRKQLLADPGSTREKAGHLRFKQNMRNSSQIIFFLNLLHVHFPR